MIRDFDETGGRPLRGPESFKRPKLHELDLELLASNEGQASVKLQQVLDLFKAGKITLGVRRAKELTVWLEGEPYLIYACNLSWLMWHVSTYAPPAVARRMVWRALSTLPAKGIQVTSAVFGYVSLAKVHRRRGCAQRVRACCRHMLKKWSDNDMHNLAYLPYFYLSELLYLEGKYAEALLLMDKVLINIERYGASTTCKCCMPSSSRRLASVRKLILLTLPSSRNSGTIPICRVPYTRRSGVALTVRRTR